MRPPPAYEFTADIEGVSEYSQPLDGRRGVEPVRSINITYMIGGEQEWAQLPYPQGDAAAAWRHRGKVRITVTFEETT